MLVSVALFGLGTTSVFAEVPGSVTRYFDDVQRVGHTPGPQQPPHAAAGNHGGPHAAFASGSSHFREFDASAAKPVNGTGVDFNEIIFGRHHPTLWRGGVVLSAVAVLLLVLFALDKCWERRRGEQSRDISMTQPLHDPTNESAE
eukprot:g4445.t1